MRKGSKTLKQKSAHILSIQLVQEWQKQEWTSKSCNTSWDAVTFLWKGGYINKYL